MNNSTHPLFRIQNLRKTYQVGEIQVQALDGVNLEFYSHELVVLLGASGSGKSTLLNILGGLDTPTSGEVIYQGRPLGQMTEDELTLYRREHVGFVFQFYNLIPSLTAAENVELVTSLVKQSFTPHEALALVGLSERSGHFPSQLSGGEQQRVAIARAVGKKPAILLCDEPTGALDSKTGRKVLEAILKVHEDLGTLVVLITHNASVANLADRVIRLADGRVIKDERLSRKKSLAEIDW